MSKKMPKCECGQRGDHEATPECEKRVGINIVEFAKSAPKLAEMMVEANAGYASVGAAEIEGGPEVVLVIVVRGEHECREIKSICDAVSDAWGE